MKINRVDRIMQTYRSMDSKKAQSKDKTSIKDELEVSEKAIDYQFAINKLKELPSIRKEKADKIKGEIASGTYSIDGNKIAERMLETIEFDKKA